MRQFPGRKGGVCTALGVALGVAGGCRGPSVVPVPIVGDGYAISLQRVSASRSVDFKTMTQSVTVGISLELDRANLDGSTPSSNPRLTLRVVQDEDGASVPISEDEVRSNAVREGDLRSYAMLVGLMGTPAKRTVGVGGGGVRGFARMPRRLKLVSGTVEYEQLREFRELDVALADVASPKEVTPGLTLQASITTPRRGEVRVRVTQTVTSPKGAEHAVPPLAVTIDLLDQYGGVIARAERRSSQASATRILSDAEFLGFVPPEWSPTTLRLTLGSGVEHIRLPFEFRDVPVSLE